jgi:hypothetical protein
MIQFREKGLRGDSGENVKKAYEKFSSIKPGVPTNLMIVVEAYKLGDKRNHDELFQLADQFTQYIIGIYRDTARVNNTIANSIPRSLIYNYPDTNNSIIYSKLESWFDTADFYYNSLWESDENIKWHNSLRLLQSFDEFLNVLLGYFIICWKCTLGLPYNKKTFKTKYGMKYNDFEKLLGENKDNFYLIYLLGNYHLRNAIAHEEIWKDDKANLIRYKDNDKDFTMPINMYWGKVGIISYLPPSFLVAIATIDVFRHGTMDDVKQLPIHLINLFIDKKPIIKPPTG